METLNCSIPGTDFDDNDDYSDRKIFFNYLLLLLTTYYYSDGMFSGKFGAAIFDAGPQSDQHGANRRSFNQFIL